MYYGSSDYVLPVWVGNTLVPALNCCTWFESVDCCFPSIPAKPSQCSLCHEKGIPLWHRDGLASTFCDDCISVNVKNIVGIATIGSKKTSMGPISPTELRHSSGTCTQQAPPTMANASTNVRPAKKRAPVGLRTDLSFDRGNHGQLVQRPPAPEVVHVCICIWFNKCTCILYG